MSKIVEAIAEAIYTARTGTCTFNELRNILRKGLDEATVLVYREDKSIPLPKYAKDGDCCMDVYAYRIEKDTEKNRVIVHTGLHFVLPEDYEMELRPRSSNTKYRWAILNAPGTLDEKYIGELLVIFSPLDEHNLNNFPYNIGDRICQLLVRHRERISFLEVDKDDLPNTDRGGNGFGSTGK